MAEDAGGVGEGSCSCTAGHLEPAGRGTGMRSMASGAGSVSVIFKNKVDVDAEQEKVSGQLHIAGRIHFCKNLCGTQLLSHRRKEQTMLGNPTVVGGFGQAVLQEGATGTHLACNSLSNLTLAFLPTPSHMNGVGSNSVQTTGTPSTFAPHSSRYTGGMI